MTETRAVAHLPQLDIEIGHRELEDEGAEILTISLKAKPNLESAANWLAPTWAIWNPWFMWHQTMLTAWKPWLDIPGTPKPHLLGETKDSENRD